MIELVVSVSIFLIVVVISTTAFTRALRSQRSIIALMGINDNINQAIEQMMREIRTGTGFEAPYVQGLSSCSGGACGPELHFTNAKGESVVFYTDEGKIIRKAGSTNFPITADNVSDLLSVAEVHNSPQLQIFCQQFLESL